jgi:hypothetical protein
MTAGESEKPKVDEDHIRRRAHLIWIEDGKPEGRAMDHWLRARWELEQVPDPKAEHRQGEGAPEPGGKPV